MDQSTIGFAVYEDGKEHMGVASLTLPNLNFIIQTMNGAGIAGNVDYPVIGQMEAMELGINFRTTQKNASKLAAPKRHQIECRSAQQGDNPVAGKLTVDNVKHSFVVLPKTLTGGSVAPAAPTNGSGTYSVLYWKETVNGEVTKELDPVNFICFIDGVDYLADVRKILGK